MAIFLGDISAFTLWFKDQRRIWRAEPCAETPLEVGAESSVDEILQSELAFLELNTRPIHVIVADSSRMRRSSRAIAHLWTPPYPDGSFVRLSKHVYTLSPIAALMRYSTKLGPLAVLGALYQACGTYCTIHSELRERAPLTTLENAGRYISHAKGIHGVASVRDALPFVLEGAASPREAAIAYALIAPVTRQGYALPRPLLNHPIPTRTTTRFADFCWPDARLILEYDSDTFHVGRNRIASDAMRRTELMLAEYKVITLTNTQLTSFAQFDAVVEAIRDHLGIYEAPLTPCRLQARAKLQRALFERSVFQ